MNTKQLKKRPALLLIVLLIATTISCWAAKSESIKKKEITKSFNVSPNDLLVTDNRYGNTTITHWNKKEIAIRVEIEAKAKNAESAQACIDRVHIDINKSGSKVSAITSLKKSSSNDNSNQRFTINYFISMPAGLSIDLSQKYGNIHLPEKNEGKSKIQIKYGNLNAGSFTQPLELEVKYGNVTINHVTKAKLDLGYCGNMSMGNADELIVDKKYSNMKIRECGRLYLENKYGHIQIERLDKGTMDIKYSEASIDFLKEALEMDGLSYSTLNIGELSASFNQVNIEAHYSHLNIGIPAKASFKLSAENMKYGSRSVKGFHITNTSSKDKVNHYYEINGGNKGSIRFDGNSYSHINIKAL